MTAANFGEVRPGMEPTKFSVHLWRVFDAARSSGQWLTSRDIAIRSGVAGRTARAHASRLAGLGLFEVAEVFPAYRYRISKLADKRSKAMLQRLEAAGQVFAGTDAG